MSNSRKPNFRIWTLCACLTFAAGSARPDQAVGLTGLTDQVQKFRPEGMSLAPFAGRDDKNGLVYGFGSFFFRDHDPGYTLNFYGVTNLDKFFSATLVHENWLEGPWIYDTQTTVERAFDEWYGEGDHTASANPFVLKMDHVAFKGSARYRLNSWFSLGPLAEFRQFREFGVERAEAGQPGDPSVIFPDESAWAFGLKLGADTRDSKLFPSEGFYGTLEVKHLPSLAAYLESDQGLTQSEAEARFFHSILPGLVSASRLMGGVSSGEPGYIWRYRLGGVELLRGYDDNRFRGKNFWAGQEELRFPVYKIITGAVSIDAGDVGDPDFFQPKVSAQAGLRLALPPDWGMRARFEYGVGEDQHTFNVQFGEVF